MYRDRERDIYYELGDYGISYVSISFSVDCMMLYCAMIYELSVYYYDIEYITIIYYYYYNIIFRILRAARPGTPARRGPARRPLLFVLFVFKYKKIKKIHKYK